MEPLHKSFSSFRTAHPSTKRAPHPELVEGEARAAQGEGAEPESIFFNAFLDPGSPLREPAPAKAGGRGDGSGVSQTFLISARIGHGPCFGGAGLSSVSEIAQTSNNSNSPSTLSFPSDPGPKNFGSRYLIPQRSSAPGTGTRTVLVLVMAVVALDFGLTERIVSCIPSVNIDIRANPVSMVDDLIRSPGPRKRAATRQAFPGTQTNIRHVRMGQGAFGPCLASQSGRGEEKNNSGTRDTRRR
ncbi:MAG: hypothetical protein FJX42_09350 [Alphaproteobacteria bacterium]|nr:hypothetical protein [Alphaproteobacteria bacterium]